MANATHPIRPELVAAAGASAAGDVTLVAATLLAGRWPSPAIQCLACFAIADGVAQLVLLSAAWVDSLPDASGILCTAQAVVNWSAVWATWLWMAAFAWTVRNVFTSPWRLATQRSKACLHAVCWGAPILAAVAVAAAGRFGRSSAGAVCSFWFGPGDEIIHVLAFAPLWASLAFNAFAFASVLRLVRAALALSAGLLQTEEEASRARRLRLWPRFAMYMACFFGSQALCAVLVALSSFLEPSATSSATFGVLDRVSSVLAHSHGFLNAANFLFFSEACGPNESATPSATASSSHSRGHHTPLLAEAPHGPEGQEETPEAGARGRA